MKSPVDVLGGFCLQRVGLPKSYEEFLDSSGLQSSANGRWVLTLPQKCVRIQVEIPPLPLLDHQ